MVGVVVWWWWGGGGGGGGVGGGGRREAKVKLRNVYCSCYCFIYFIDWIFFYQRNYWIGECISTLAVGLLNNLGCFFVGSH